MLSYQWVQQKAYEINLAEDLKWGVRGVSFLKKGILIGFVYSVQYKSATNI